jgi:hypothetical protein
MNTIDLRCCGNCEYFQGYECPLYEEVDEETHAYPDPGEVCDNWVYDGKDYQERKAV